MTQHNHDHTIPDSTDGTDPQSVLTQTQPKDERVVSGQSAEINSPPATSIEGNGEVLSSRSEVLGSRRHGRADARLVSRALRNGWDVPTALRAKVVERLDKHLDSPDDRTSIAAARAVIEINKQNIEIDTAEDKAARLDAGLATDRVEMPVRFIRGTDGEGV